MATQFRGIERPRAQVARGTAAQGGLGLTGIANAEHALRAARSRCTILITGETGSGKGFLARWLHENSPRVDGPFIPVNCGAIPDSLIDSQLFGHARGAFSGATTRHLGLVRAAENGTLLLDEVSELPPSAQNRLLRLLQEREVQPVGHSRPMKVDVRVLASTNIELEEAVSDGMFREDLLFRLDVIQLRVMPLRERMNELPRLLEKFNLEFAAMYRQDVLEFDPQSIRVLEAYHWPGNIRQLRTLVERLHVLCPGERVCVEHLIGPGQLTPPPKLCIGPDSIDQLKQDQLRKVLLASDGSISRTAEAFGVHRSTIYRWLRRSEA